MSEIVCNSVIEWRDEKLNISSVERILWISPDSTTVVVIDIGNMTNWPIVRFLDELESALKEGTAKRLTVDPYSRFFNSSDDYIIKHIKTRDNAWTAIKGIVEEEPNIYDPPHRGRLVRQVCEEQGLHKKVVYDYLRRYWIRGKTINALLPEFYKCGAPGQERISLGTCKRGRRPIVSQADQELIGINVTESDRKRIRTAIKELYLTPQKPSLTYVYQEMKRNYYNQSVTIVDGKYIPIMLPDNEIISFAQFKYWANKELAAMNNSLERRVGRRKYLLKNRPLLGNATTRAFGPGSIFEIDATVADVYLVSLFDRTRIIGRPVVYTLKDVFSRMVVGVYVGLEGPSWLGAMMAIENTTCDKVSFCAEYGISIDEEDWPCRHLPKTITADRGEMEGKNADNAALSLGIRIDNAPPYRADLKGIIEQHFHIYKGSIGPFIPGAVDKLLRERGEPDYRLGARLSIKGFTRVIIYSILEHNKSELSDYPLGKDMTYDQVPPIPLELWNWGIVNCSGKLQERQREIIRLNLMPRIEASITRQGIVVNFGQGPVRYSCEEALRYGWYEQALKGRFHMQVAYDPRNVESIYIPEKDGGSYIRCELLDRFERFRGARAEEVQDQLFFERIQSSKRKSGQNQNVAMYATLRHQVMQEEIKLTEAELDSTRSAASRTKDIRAARREEKASIREEEAWNLGEDTGRSSRTAAVFPFKGGSQTIMDTESQDPLLDMIKKQAERSDKE
jgi:putative transposase